MLLLSIFQIVNAFLNIIRYCILKYQNSSTVLIIAVMKSLELRVLSSIELHKAS